jgi:hypothetical protein
MPTSTTPAGDVVPNPGASSKGWIGLLVISAVLLGAAILVPVTYSGPPPSPLSFDSRGLDSMVGLLIGSAGAYFLGFWKGVVAKGRRKRVFILSLVPILGLLILLLLPPHQSLGRD